MYLWVRLCKFEPIANLMTFRYCYLRPGKSRPYWARSKTVGASCFVYFIPALCYFELARGCDCHKTYGLSSIMAIGFFLVAITAFMSEFVHIPELSASEKSDFCLNPARYPPSLWGIRDRYLSFVVTCLGSFEGVGRVGTIEVVVALSLCSGFISLSRNATSTEDWIIRHSVWHIASSLIASIITIL